MKKSTEEARDLVKSLLSAGKSLEEITLELIRQFPINFSKAGSIKFIKAVKESM